MRVALGIINMLASFESAIGWYTTPPKGVWKILVTEINALKYTPLSVSWYVQRRLALQLKGSIARVFCNLLGELRLCRIFPPVKVLLFHMIGIILPFDRLIASNASLQGCLNAQRPF